MNESGTTVRPPLHPEFSSSWPGTSRCSVRTAHVPGELRVANKGRAAVEILIQQGPLEVRSNDRVLPSNAALA